MWLYCRNVMLSEMLPLKLIQQSGTVCWVAYHCCVIRDVAIETDTAVWHCLLGGLSLLCYQRCCHWNWYSSLALFVRWLITVVDASGNLSRELRGSTEPTLEAELYRRAVENDVIEMWYYMKSQLTQLKHQLEASVQSLKNANNNDVDEFSVRSIITRVTDIIDTGVDYKQYVCVCLWWHGVSV